MNTELPKKYQRWAKIRQKGIVKYILVNNVIYRGLFICLFMNGYYYFFHDDFSATQAEVICVTFILASILRGFYIWQVSETGYEKYEKYLLNED